MNEQMRKVVVPAIVGVSGLSVGGVLGYILGRRKTQQEFDEVAVSIDRHMMAQEKEIQMLKGSMREQFDRHVASIVETPLTDEVNYEAHTSYDLMVDGEKIREIKDVILRDVSINSDGSGTGHIVSVEPVDRVVNVFDNTIPGWDWEMELNSRSNKSLYVITSEEFFADDMGYRQSTVTWYAGDRTLADEREQPIYNWSSIVGTELPFGHGSGDENVVYIRNEELRMEYEICMTPAAHGVEVIGLEIEADYADQDIRHSAAPLKFRRE